MAKLSGVQYTHVPYKGAAPMMQDLIGNRIDFTVMAFLMMMTQAIQSGQYRIIANMTKDAPKELANMAQHRIGFRDVDYASNAAYYVRKGTPAAIRQKLNQALGEALTVGDVAPKLEADGRLVHRWAVRSRTPRRSTGPRSPPTSASSRTPDSNRSIDQARRPGPRVARIAIGGFQTQSASLTAHTADFGISPSIATGPPFVTGDAIVAALRGGGYATSGFLDGLGPDDEVVPLVWASGGAGGEVSDDAFERIVGVLAGRLSASLPVDGVYLDLHGAMVNATFDDAEGELRQSGRSRAPQTPIVVSLDYHANVSPDMIRHADGVVVFRTYPHVDRPQTGRRAARLLARLIADGRPAGRALRKLPFLLPIDFQCTLAEPSRSVVNWRPADDHALLTTGYAAGFPPSDTVWCGRSGVCLCNPPGHRRRRRRCLPAVRPRTTGRSLPHRCGRSGRRYRSAAAGTARATAGDHCRHPRQSGCGGSGDTTGILGGAYLRERAGRRTGFLLRCRRRAWAALDAGVGVMVDVLLGGRHGPAEVRPLPTRLKCSAAPTDPSG